MYTAYIGVEEDIYRSSAEVGGKGIIRRHVGRGMQMGGPEGVAAKEMFRLAVLVDGGLWMHCLPRPLPSDTAAVPTA